MIYSLFSLGGDVGSDLIRKSDGEELKNFRRSKAIFPFENMDPTKLDKGNRFNFQAP